MPARPGRRCWAHPPRAGRARALPTARPAAAEPRRLSSVWPGWACPSPAAGREGCPGRPPPGPIRPIPKVSSMSELLDRMMDFDLSEDQRLVRQTVRKFAEAEILPHVERFEREERYPSELIAKLPPLGLLGPMIPESYGGSFTDVVTYGVICEELARVDWVVASVVSVANSLVAGSLLRFGTPQQKERYLPGIARGEIICSACLTEPRGGTDLGNMETT